MARRLAAAGLAIALFALVVAGFAVREASAARAELREISRSLEEALGHRPASSAPMLGPPLELDESGLDR